jgi:hypothetical protein
MKFDDFERMLASQRKMEISKTFRIGERLWVMNLTTLIGR